MCSLEEIIFPRGHRPRKIWFLRVNKFSYLLLKGKLMFYSTTHLQNVHVLFVICPHLFHSYGTLCFLLLVLSCYENSVSFCMSIDACCFKKKSLLKSLSVNTPSLLQRSVIFEFEKEDKLNSNLYFNKNKLYESETIIK